MRHPIAPLSDYYVLVIWHRLPKVCKLIASKQGYFSLGQIQMDAFKRLFLFEFVWVFLGITLGSSALALVDNFEHLIDHPMAFFSTVCQQLADSATFFMVYLSVQFSFALPFKELVRANELGLFVARRAVAKFIKRAPTGNENAASDKAVEDEATPKPEPIKYHQVPANRY
jgi:hypothetical protein